MWRNLCLRVGSLTLERAALIVGFGLSIVATIGSQLYLAPVATHVQTTVQTLDETWARLKIIRGANALFYLLQSFDGLVHLVPADFNANPGGADVVLAIGIRAIHDRHDAVRNYFAQAASAGEIDYRNVIGRYEDLVTAEAANWNLKTYGETNALPAEVNMKVAADRWELEKSALQLEGDFYRSRFQQDQRAWILTLLNVMGSSILFALALLAARERQPRAGPLDEMTKATDLMNLALVETRRRIAAAKASG